MDREDIEEMFQSLGPVTIKRMFGGKGIYADGLILALELRGDLLIKGDAVVAGDYEAAGAKRWTYEHNKTGKQVAMPYWSMPAEAFDDPDVMAKWVRLAYEAARRAK